MKKLRGSATRIIKILSISATALLSLQLSHGNPRLTEVKKRVTAGLTSSLAKKGLKLGDEVYLRAYKAEHELEVWMKPAGKEKFLLYKTYEIAGSSGVLGPKRAEGDRQMPEGFYTIVPSALNPASRYHLSFNIGYPNSYDRYHKRTGSFIMVHGSNVSIGCYAMTDPVIEEIYLLVEADLSDGDKAVPFHSYPFKFSRKWEKKHDDSPWYDFWKTLASADLAFNKSKIPPVVTHSKGEYVIKTP